MVILNKIFVFVYRNSLRILDTTLKGKSKIWFLVFLITPFSFLFFQAEARIGEERTNLEIRLFRSGGLHIKT